MSTCTRNTRGCQLSAVCCLAGLKSMVVIIAVLATAQLSAQVLERQLVASTGNTASSASFLIDFSVGDLVVNTSSSASFTLTQGYQQNTDFSTSVVASADAPFNISVFPNPTRDMITVQWNSDPAAILKLVVMDATGREVIAARNYPGGSALLDLSPLAAGSYVVHALINERFEMLRVQKVR